MNVKQIATSRWLPWTLVVVLTVFAIASQRDVNWQKVARQNAEAALDSTRKIETRHGDVFARLIAQKDVELAGALAAAAHLRGLHSKAELPVVVVARGVDTTVTHTGVGPVVGGTERGIQARSDSLVLAGPPVEGVVKATVQDSTFIWAARLRPSKVPLTVAVGCGKRGPEALVSGPDWVDTEIKPSVIDPKVCNPPGSKFWTGVKYGAGVTAALLIAHNVLHLF